MTLTLNLPPELEQYLTQQAQQQGLSVETYTLELIQKSIFQLEKNSAFEETPT
jgi:predicted HicB family RNase H-like nuclease